MGNAITRTIKKSSAALLTDEIMGLFDKISENARLARETEKELVKLRKTNDKSFDQMRKAMARLSS